MEFHSFYEYLGSLSLAGILTFCAAMYFFAVVVLFPMRYLFEGVAYNVARSSNIGDFCLVWIIFFAWGLLNTGVKPPAWASGFSWQLGCAVVGTIIALIFSFGQTPLERPHVTDIYHNSVVMGFMVFILVYVAPLILWSNDLMTIFGALCLLSIWIGFVVSDTNSGRMQQREWLAEHHPNLRFKS